MLKEDLEKLLINKTIAEAQRLVKQYDYKMIISEYNGSQNTVSSFDKKSCVVTVVNDKIATAWFAKGKEKK
jgi:hypothetical protein